jgi:hypothetical protein
VIEPFRERCPDCQVGVGVEHSDGCDVARCMDNGGQRLACSAFQETRHAGYCGDDTWSGYWPGVMECEEFGWWSRMAPGVGWQSFDFWFPGAAHDLNRLVLEGVWDREARRWRLK